MLFAKEFPSRQELEFFLGCVLPVDVLDLLVEAKHFEERSNRRTCTKILVPQALHAENPLRLATFSHCSLSASTICLTGLMRRKKPNEHLTLAA